MIRVYHRIDIADRDLRLDFDFARGEKLVELVEANLDKYKQVALCASTSDLNEAYRLTNTIDRAWFMNDDIDEVLPSLTARKGCRSTSIGDILVDEDDNFKRYVVDSYGFTELKGARI